ncbi:hypothetical protein LJC15_04635 [Desulfovibrio sp. OttesenSCG-928-G11]|nr:hypothetical protein [Desulfovibrio sp. OttesenSCG-928-G11]
MGAEIFIVRCLRRPGALPLNPGRGMMPLHPRYLRQNLRYQQENRGTWSQRAFLKKPDGLFQDRLIRSAGMRCLFAFLALLLFAPGPASAARLSVAPEFSIDVPGDWQHRRAVRDAAPAEVRALMECIDEDPDRLVLAGWKMEGELMQGAFCLSFWDRGGAGTLKLLKGPGKDEAFARFADIFAAKIHKGYTARKVEMGEFSATLLDAGNMAVTTIDGRIKTGGRTFMRSDTVFLRGDAILNVSTIRDLSAPAIVGRQTEALPLSVEWQ